MGDDVDNRHNPRYPVDEENDDTIVLCVFSYDPARSEPVVYQVDTLQKVGNSVSKRGSNVPKQNF